MPALQNPHRWGACQGVGPCTPLMPCRAGSWHTKPQLHDSPSLKDTGHCISPLKFLCANFEGTEPIDLDTDEAIVDRWQFYETHVLVSENSHFVTLMPWKALTAQQLDLRLSLACQRL